MALPLPLRASRQAQHPLCCASAGSAWTVCTPSARPRSRHTCHASASASDGPAGQLPVVDDAISLPPPATGSQYAWRRSWGGSQASGSGGGGGGSGRSWRARTAEWGRGPNSSILFVILYRMRLLLLYGVWVTVLYGAFRAVVDLTTAAGKAGYHLVDKAATLLYGPAGSGSRDGDGSGSSTSAMGLAPDTAAAAAAATDCSPEAEVSGELPQGSGEHAADGAGSSSSFPASRHKSRPPFEDMLSAVIPVYLMLLGSVVFFASI